MERYVIIPKEFMSNVIEAENANEAVIQFATAMDTDMNQYFRAVPVDKVDQILAVKRHEIHRQYVIDWMIDTIMDDFDIEDADKAEDLAEMAYERYCDGNGETEYECIEWAVENDKEE